MKLFFIVNSISGGIDKEPFLSNARALYCKYGIDYEIFKPPGQNDEDNLLSAINKFQSDKVASVGGDGTTLFTAVSLYKMNYPIGIVPLGSANGMAAELFVNPDHGSFKRHSYVKCNWRFRFGIGK